VTFEKDMATSRLRAIS